MPRISRKVRVTNFRKLTVSCLDLVLCGVVIDLQPMSPHCLACTMCAVHAAHGHYMNHKHTGTESNSMFCG